MRVHWLQHAEHEDLGCIAPWLAARDAHVSMSCLPAGDALPAPDAFDVLLVMGGPMNIYQHAEHPWLVAEKTLIRASIDAGKKLLGVCLGAQLIADALGAPVTRNAHDEIGWFDVSLNAEGRRHPLFAEWPERFPALHWHGDTFAIPAGAHNLMHSEACARQGYALGKQILGLQFHLEVTAADAARWLALEPTTPARYVQSSEVILEDIARFALNNRLMAKLLDAFLGR